jgi:3-phenylpropionate/trans-cinnamate dioxygenase ferredoxin component
MFAFQKVASKEEITPKRPKIVMLGEFEIVLFQVGEEIFAIENLCPHQQFSVFHQGVVDGYTIACPMHSWSFDLRTGKAIMGSGRVRTFEVRIDGDSVLVKQPDPTQHFPRF